MYQAEPVQVRNPVEPPINHSGSRTIKKRTSRDLINRTCYVVINEGRCLVQWRETFRATKGALVHSQPVKEGELGCFSSNYCLYCV